MNLSVWPAVKVFLLLVAVFNLTGCPQTAPNHTPARVLKAVPAFECASGSTEMFLPEEEGLSRSCAYLSGPFAGADEGVVVFKGTYWPETKDRRIDFIDKDFARRHPDIAAQLPDCAPVCYGITKNLGEHLPMNALALQAWADANELTCPHPSQEATLQHFNATISTVSCQVLHGSYFFVGEEGQVTYGAYNLGAEAGDWSYTDGQKRVLETEHFDPAPKGWPALKPDAPQ